MERLPAGHFRFVAAMAGNLEICKGFPASNFEGMILCLLVEQG